MHHQQATKRTRNARPKLFQCKGYGDCNMVFTRSEHLARHSRKHTGEKPFICIVPECKKAFSRFDNMMQHTQTHRNNQYNIISGHPRDRKHKDGPGDTTAHAFSTRAQTRQNGKGVKSCESQHNNNNQQKGNPRKQSIYNQQQLHIQTSPSSYSPNEGLISPISLSSPHHQQPLPHHSSSDEEEEEEDSLIRTPPLKNQTSRRRLSVADLCNPVQPTSIHTLTKDEVEALEGFGRFRHTPTVFFDSLKDLVAK